MKSIYSYILGLTLMSVSGAASAQISPNSSQQISVGPSLQAASMNQWQIVGNAKFAHAHRGLSLAIYDSKPYVVFPDSENNKKIKVMTLNSAGNGWVNVGQASISVGEGKTPDIEVFGQDMYISFIDVDAGRKVTVMHYNRPNNIWDVVGMRGMNGIVSRGTDLEIFGGTPYVATTAYGTFAGQSTNLGVTVLKFDKSSGQWAPFGEEHFSGPGVPSNDVDLEFKGAIPYVSYGVNQNGAASHNNYFEVRRLNTSGSWGLVKKFTEAERGPGAGIETFKEDLYLGVGAVRRHNPTNNQWPILGTEKKVWDLEVMKGKLLIAHTSLIDIPGTSRRRNAVTVEKFENATWVPVGQTHFNPVGQPGMLYNYSLDLEIDQHKNIPYIAYFGNASHRNLTVMKYDRINLEVLTQTPSTAMISAPTMTVAPVQAMRGRKLKAEEKLKVEKEKFNKK